MHEQLTLVPAALVPTVRSLNKIYQLFEDRFRFTHMMENMGNGYRDDEKFLLFDDEIHVTVKGKQKSAGFAYVWASHIGVRAALKYGKWTVDGTFKASPKLFKQVGCIVIRVDCC